MKRKKMYGVIFTMIFFSCFMGACKNQQVDQNPKETESVSGLEKDVSDEKKEIQFETMNLDMLFDEKQYVASEGIGWKITLDDFIEHLPNPEEVDPQSDEFVEYSNMTMNNNHTSLQPPLEIYFSDLEMSWKPVYLFDEEKELYCAKYGVILEEREKYSTLLQGVLRELSDRFPDEIFKEPTSSLTMEEFLENLDEFDCNEERLDVVWKDEDQKTFLRINAAKFQERYKVDLIVGLTAYFKTV